MLIQSDSLAWGPHDAQLPSVHIGPQDAAKTFESSLIAKAVGFLNHADPTALDDPLLLSHALPTQSAGYWPKPEPIGALEAPFSLNELGLFGGCGTVGPSASGFFNVLSSNDPFESMMTDAELSMSNPWLACTNMTSTQQPGVSAFMPDFCVTEPSADQFIDVGRGPQNNEPSMHHPSSLFEHGRETTPDLSSASSLSDSCSNAGDDWLTMLDQAWVDNEPVAEDPFHGCGQSYWPTLATLPFAPSFDCNDAQCPAQCYSPTGTDYGVDLATLRQSLKEIEVDASSPASTVSPNVLMSPPTFNAALVAGSPETVVADPNPTPAPARKRKASPKAGTKAKPKVTPKPKAATKKRGKQTKPSTGTIQPIELTPQLDGGNGQAPQLQQPDSISQPSITTTLSTALDPEAQSTQHDTAISQLYATIPIPTAQDLAVASAAQSAHPVPPAKKTRKPRAKSIPAAKRTTKAKSSSTTSVTNPQRTKTTRKLLPSERPVCEVCCNSFASKHNLRAHMKTHDPNRKKDFHCGMTECILAYKEYFNFRDVGRHCELTHCERNASKFGFFYTGQDKCTNKGVSETPQLYWLAEANRPQKAR